MRISDDKEREIATLLDEVVPEPDSMRFTGRRRRPLPFPLCDGQSRYHAAGRTPVVITLAVVQEPDSMLSGPAGKPAAFV